ncbi:MAG TPA: PAS domain S-box protein [Steroidobacter sp.]|uniref:PAS domain-containing sensor histidine kinase n=1 Tax=Steroidobacter sp. TaxID=1978227 RepID=UPI002EDAA212
MTSAKTIDAPAVGGATPAEDGLRSALQTDLMRQLVGAVAEFVFVVDRSLRIVMANRGIGERTVKQIEGSLITEFFPPGLHARALSTLHRVLANGQVDGYVTEIEGSDGQSRHFDVRVSPIREGQKIVALAVVTSETTEQVRAERAIATQARMIESMLEGVAVIDERGIIEITNPAFDTLFGYRRGELIGRDMAMLAGWPFEQPERWQPLSAKQGRSMQVEFDGRRANDSHFAAAGVLSRFEVAGRNHSLLVLQDVSERKQLERAILQAVSREQYRIGNDLHDGLGQELTGIALMLRGLAGRLTTEYPVILPEIEGITRLVNSSIESTRALARGLSPVNLERGGLSDALEGLAMHASELYGVQVTCTHRVKTTRPLSTELANHLYRIAQEAVRNAVRHGQARSIRLHLHGARAKVRLTVTDDGLGMPAHAVDAPGMGLKIMRYRARILGGEVRFERGVPDAAIQDARPGTRIICECPLEPAADAVRARRPRRPASHGVN